MNKNFKFCNPKNKTWYILWDNERKEIKSYSSITPKQCIESIFSEIDYYTTEKKWIKALKINGKEPLTNKFI